MYYKTQGTDEFLFNPAPVRILGTIRKNWAINKKRLSKLAYVTYSHTCQVLKILEERGIVDFVNEGKEIEVFLTEDGEKIADHMADIKVILNA